MSKRTYTCFMLRMTMSAGDEQSGLREVRFSIYDTSTGADELIRRANQTVERAEAVSCCICNELRDVMKQFLNMRSLITCSNDMYMNSPALR